MDLVPEEDFVQQVHIFDSTKLFFNPLHQGLFSTKLFYAENQAT